MSEVTMTVAIRELPGVKALVNDLIRVREEIDTVVRGITGESPHIGELVEQRWPQMRVVRLGNDVAEIRIGGARWMIPGDRWDEASDFLERVRHQWDMRVVWADSGTPVDGDCAKRLLDENARLRAFVEGVAKHPDIGDSLTAAEREVEIQKRARAVLSNSKSKS
jgi:hypothetical protein